MRVAWEKDALGQWKMTEVPDSQGFFKADLVLLALGFLGPEDAAIKSLGLEQDARSNIRTPQGKYLTGVEGVFAAGDCRRGQVHLASFAFAALFQQRLTLAHDARSRSSCTASTRAARARPRSTVSSSATRASRTPAASRSARSHLPSSTSHARRRTSPLSRSRPSLLERVLVQPIKEKRATHTLCLLPHPCFFYPSLLSHPVNACCR